MNLICGINPVLEALAAGARHFDRLLVVKGLRNKRISEAIARAGRQGIPLRFEPREALDRIAGGVPHQGLIAVVSAKALMSLEQVLETAHEPALIVALDGVEDPRNLGAILRTAEAAGVDGVVIPERHSAGLSETVARASAGALEHVRIARAGNLVQTLTALKARGIWVIGLDATGGERWDQVDCRRPIALVLGGEGRGLRRLVREHCDHLVSLPLFGHVGSLNVSVAAGIALYEVVRQRGTVPSHVRPIPARAATPSAIVGPRADDDEHDPGAMARPVGPSEGDGYEDDKDQPTEAGFVEIHEEEAAWTGPTVLRSAGFSRRSGAGGGSLRGRRRPFGPRGGGSGPRREGQGPRRDAPPARRDAPQTEGASGPIAPSEPGRHRRHRRKGGRPAGPPAPPPAVGDAPASPPPQGETKGGEGPQGAEGPKGDRPGRRRRRRRRR